CLDAAAKEGEVDRLVVAGEEPAHDLRPGVVEAAAEATPGRVADRHRLLRAPGPVETGDGGAVHPRVAAADGQLSARGEGPPGRRPRHGAHGTCEDSGRPRAPGQVRRRAGPARI